MGTLTRGAVQPPQLLLPSHELGEFCCGQEVLDTWLGQHAISNQNNGASRTYVVTTSRDAVVGYYSLAPSALESKLAIGAIRRNAPSPVPMYLLGRLAVDNNWQGNGIASSMIRDAQQRVQAAARIVGGKGLMCHAIDARAKAFYASQGFSTSPIAPLLLMLSFGRAPKAASIDEARPRRLTTDQRASPTILMSTPAVFCINGVARLLVGVTRHKVLWMSAFANGVVTRRSGRS